VLNLISSGIDPRKTYVRHSEFHDCNQCMKNTCTLHTNKSTKLSSQEEKGGKRKEKRKEGSNFAVVPPIPPWGSQLSGGLTEHDA